MGGKSDNDEDAKFELKKEIGLGGGVAIVAGTMVGAGIFATPVGILAGVNGSVGASLVVWAACGLIAGMAALCYCELGSAIRESGGEYAYLRCEYGPLLAFTFVWTSCIVAKNASNAAMAVTLGSYAAEAFYGDCARPPVLLIKMIGGGALLLLAYVNYTSVRASSKLQSILTLVKFSAMLVIVIGGIVTIATGSDVTDLSNAFDPERLKALTFSRVGLAFYQGLWSYDGWNNLNYITEEVKNSSKTLPRALIIAVPLVMCFYLMVNVSYLAVMSTEEMMASSAVAVTWGNRVLGGFGWIMPLAVCLSTMGAMNGAFLTNGRLPFVAARHGHMPQILAMAHVDYYTPGPAILYTSVMTCVFMIPSDFATLVNAFSFTQWIYYCLVIGGVLVLRFTRPDLHRPYKVPFLIPGLVVIIAMYLIVAPLVDKPSVIFLFVALFVLCGPLVYFVFVRHQKGIPGMDRFTVFVQKLLNVAPTYWDDENDT